MTAAVPYCSRCGAAYKAAAAFCSGCGSRRTPEPRPSDGLRTTITYYLCCLAIQAAAMIYVRITGAAFTTVVIASIGLAIVTLAFAIPDRGLVLPAYRTLGFSIGGYALVLLAAPVLVAAVLAYVHGLSTFTGMRAPRELAELGGRSAILVVVFVALLPPAVEELAFRGLIYGGLRRTLGVREAFIISSFAFAMIHLSVPSLVTHLPLGLYFCWLRQWSGSLWPPMVAHCCHNLGVLVAEWRGWV